MGRGFTFRGGLQIKQIGIIAKTDGNRAEVYIKRPTSCGGECIKCAGCETTETKIETINNKGAKVGDTVVLEMKDSRVLEAAFYVYIAPLIIFFIGFLLGDIIFNNSYASVLTGTIFLGLYLIILKKIDRASNKSRKYESQIIQILS